MTGRVTGAEGSPEGAVLVRINALNAGATTSTDGTYTLVIPASRVRAGQTVQITASRVGLATQSRMVTLNPGANLTQNFQLTADVLQLEGIVATGQGVVTTRERVTTSISTVRSEEITRSNEPNVVTALAAKAPGVIVTSSSGDPGAGTYMRIRDAASIVGGTQPLFVIDGTPVDNSTNTVTGTTTGTSQSNRGADINPNDVETVEILKGAAATAIYGSRGANGVVLITTKRGRAGRTQVTYNLTAGRDEVSQLPGLQRSNGRGLSYLAYIPTYPTIQALNDDFGTTFANFDQARAAFKDSVFTSAASFGRALGSTETFDHAGELYETGSRLENNLTVSGGSDRTTYFLGLGRSTVDGTLRGNSAFERSSLRLKGSHDLFEDLQITGNVAFARTEADLVQQGSNTSGILLGALRTPPEFNNCLPAAELKPGQPCYVNPTTGFQRSYRRPNPTDINQSSLYDNPFFVAQAGQNTTEVGRTNGNVGLNYTPVSWLRLNYLLGVDYYGDEQLQYQPNSSAGSPTGSLITANFTSLILDSNLTATATGKLSSSLEGSFTVGQNLNQEQYSRNLLTTTNLFPGTRQADFGVDRIPNEFEYETRTDGYFATTELTFADQLTLTGTGRLDGSSTFGGEGERFFYPSVGASWTFSKLGFFDNASWLDFAKLRGSWGRVGRQPPVFSNTSGYTTGLFNDTYVNNGLNSVYSGRTGIFSQGLRGNPGIRPEVKREAEIGGDVAFLGRRVSAGVTYYNNKTSDAILTVPTAYSLGRVQEYANVAEFDGSGWELSLDLAPVTTRKFSWVLNSNYTRSRTCVTSLAGTEELSLDGFTGSTVSLVAPDAAGTVGCNPFGVFYGNDFVRFGRGSKVDDVSIDAAFPGATKGALYIGEDGFPITDDVSRVAGDPNPDWTASIRNTFTLGSNLRVSGLFDIRRGGDVWNGTKGALYFFGTSAETERFQGEGFMAPFGGFPLANGTTPAVGGPGAGKVVPLNHATWLNGGIGSGFTGPFSQFLEDGSFVKLRDVSVSYTLAQGWLERLGVGSADITLSGRNLKTWTDYTGIDPESNLTGQSLGRGLDYFNNPQTRSYVISVNLNR
ncbi:MAG TPA: SusC/RagA family TonB-linked outer membrane protein [Longimicrobium sp.]|nr:SusC/RagA family TonB-linked outer membrane protein [Longimicrobium sp.]